MFKYIGKDPKTKYNEYYSTKWVLRNSKILDIVIFIYILFLSIFIYFENTIAVFLLGIPLSISLFLSFVAFLMTGAPKFSYIFFYEILVRILLFPYGYFIGNRMMHYVLNKKR